MIAVNDNRVATEASDILRVAENAEPRPSLTRQPPPRILLAEDDVEMRRYLSEALRSARYEVVEAKDGFRVLDYISAYRFTDDQLDVDLVISDIRMPGVDGLRLLSALRSHDHTLPVILITAFGNPETHAEAKLRGALAVVDKPFEFDELLAIVRQALEPGITSPLRSPSDGANPTN